MTEAHISLPEALQSEVRTAETKLASAREALHVFIFQHCFVVDSKPVLTGHFSKRSELEAELKRLQLAAEEAERQLYAAQQALERVTNEVNKSFHFPIETSLTR